jgi:hypothetical protein
VKKVLGVLFKSLLITALLLLLLLMLIIIILLIDSNYISNKGLPEECDTEENVAVTGAVAASCFKSRL